MTLLPKSVMSSYQSHDVIVFLEIFSSFIYKRISTQTLTVKYLFPEKSRQKTVPCENAKTFNKNHKKPSNQSTIFHQIRLKLQLIFLLFISLPPTPLNQVIWVCILCRKKQELLSKTGQWINKASSPEGLISGVTRVSCFFFCHFLPLHRDEQ